MALTIVLDSNIWIRERMLRDSVGAAVRFYLQRHNARLALPEVIRLEVIEHVREEMKRLAADARTSHRALLMLVGSLNELVLPNDSELDARASHAFEDIGVQIKDVVFSLESARASFDKCIRKAPPNGPKDQQFKDGVVWADCLRLASETPVLPVTQDTGFYAGRTYANGLAENLKREQAETEHGVTITQSLSSVPASSRGGVD